MNNLIDCTFHQICRPLNQGWCYDWVCTSRVDGENEEAYTKLQLEMYANRDNIEVYVQDADSSGTTPFLSFMLFFAGNKLHLLKLCNVRCEVLTMELVRIQVIGVWHRPGQMVPTHNITHSVTGIQVISDVVTCRLAHKPKYLCGVLPASWWSSPISNSVIFMDLKPVSIEYHRALPP